MNDSIIPGTTYPYGVNSILGNLRYERENQDARWGEQNHPIRLPANDETDRQHHRYANAQGATPDRNCAWDGILLEEVYEALAESDPVAIRAELVQAGAVIVAMIESLDRNGVAP